MTESMYMYLSCSIIWQAFDQDGSGSIDDSELRQTVEAVFRMSGVKLREKEVQECVAEIQATVKDGGGEDGCGGEDELEITKQEFIENALKSKFIVSLLQDI